MVKIKENNCLICNNLLVYPNCKAFPNGIPKKILTGEYDHTKSVDGDNGIVFEPIGDKND